MTIQANTKYTQSLKLLNHINSFLFEQQYGELEHVSNSKIEDIRKASKALSEIIRNA